MDNSLGEGPRTAVIAIGGNALIAEGEQGTIAEQFHNAREAAREVALLVEAGWRVVRIWECELHTKIERVILRLRRWLETPAGKKR